MARRWLRHATTCALGRRIRRSCGAAGPAADTPTRRPSGPGWLALTARQALPVCPVFLLQFPSPSGRPWRPAQAWQPAAAASAAVGPEAAEGGVRQRPPPSNAQHRARAGADSSHTRSRSHGRGRRAGGMWRHGAAAPGGSSAQRCAPICTDQRRCTNGAGARPSRCCSSTHSIKSPLPYPHLPCPPGPGLPCPARPLLAPALLLMSCR